MLSLLRRTPQLSAAELAELRAVQTRAEVEHARELAELRREQAETDRVERQRAERERERAEKHRRKAAAKAKARRLRRLHRWAATARTVGPLLIVNAATVGGQLSYVYDETPGHWMAPARVAVAVGVATAAESVALYVGWHAHDALLAKAHTTAARLRRASYAIAGTMALVNYSHFAGDSLTDPTALAVILGVLSSLSPWLWGLHTRRAQHVQLLREDLVDETGAQFDPARRRAFPLRSWAARRWSIDHNVRDPRRAWDGYKKDRAERATAPVGRLRGAWRALRGRPVVAPEPAPTHEPVRLDDPEIQVCADLRQQMAAARDRLTAGAARVALADRELSRWADTSAGSLWAMVDATDEPAHVRRPAPVVADEPAHESTHDAGEPVQTVDSEPAQPASRPARRADSRRPAAARRTTRRVVTEPVNESAQGTDARLTEAYERLTAELGRKPSGAELATAAGVSKATANRHKRRLTTAS